MARGGIEPPTRGFSVRRTFINHSNNQSLAALANPHSSLIQAHFRHTQSGFGTGPPEWGLMRSHCPTTRGTLLRFLGHNLAVFPHIDRRSIHARSLSCVLRRAPQSLSNSSSKVFVRSCLCSCFRLH